MIRTAEPFYATKEVARVAGVTIRQLQLWDETGIVSPCKEGGWRFYNRRDLTHILILSFLIERGLPLMQAKVMVRRLIANEWWQLIEKSAYLLTDGVWIHFAEDAEESMDILTICEAPACVVSLIAVRSSAGCAVPLEDIARPCVRK